MGRYWASALAVVLALSLSLGNPHAALAREAQGPTDNDAAERVMLTKLVEKVNMLNEEIASLRALAKLGKGDATTLELLAQLKELRIRVSDLQVKPNAQRDVPGINEVYTKGVVASVLVPERVLLVSRGRNSGMLEGAVLKVGTDGVLAKVVESRANVSAAAVENSYKGKLADLVGCTAELSAR